MDADTSPWLLSLTGLVETKTMPRVFIPFL